jgi:hypothetical protein
MNKLDGIFRFEVEDEGERVWMALVNIPSNTWGLRCHIGSLLRSSSGCNVLMYEMK